MTTLLLSSCAMVVAAGAAGVSVFLGHPAATLAFVAVVMLAAAVMWHVLDGWARFDDER